MIDESIYIETDAFEHREVKPHFINPCCFGEDLAAWLRQQLVMRLGMNYRISDPIQEDYGWGLWIRSERYPFWVAISYIGDGPTEEPAQWAITAVCDFGLNFIKRLFLKIPTEELSRIRTEIRLIIESNQEMTILQD